MNLSNLSNFALIRTSTVLDSAGKISAAFCKYSLSFVLFKECDLTASIELPVVDPDLSGFTYPVGFSLFCHFFFLTQNKVGARAPRASPLDPPLTSQCLTEFTVRRLRATSSRTSCSSSWVS